MKNNIKKAVGISLLVLFALVLSGCKILSNEAKPKPVEEVAPAVIVPAAAVSQPAL